MGAPEYGRVSWVIRRHPLPRVGGRRHFERIAGGVSRQELFQAGRRAV